MCGCLGVHAAGSKWRVDRCQLYSKGDVVPACFLRCLGEAEAQAVVVDHEVVCDPATVHDRRAVVPRHELDVAAEFEQTFLTLLFTFGR